jgi:hypothetical protein
VAAAVRAIQGFGCGKMPGMVDDLLSRILGENSRAQEGVACGV